MQRYTPCRIHVGLEQYVSYKTNKEDGPWLIGYGSKRLGRHAVTPFTKVVREEINEQLQRDLETLGDFVENLVYMPLNEKKRGAVLSYAQSVGLIQFKTSKLLELINNNASRTEIIKEWSPYLKKNCFHDPRLLDRRRSELGLYLESDKEVPLLVEHKCALPQCLLNIAANYNGSPPQIEAIEYLENKLLELDPSGEIVDTFFKMWNQRVCSTGSRFAFPGVGLNSPEILRYASSLIPHQTEIEIQELRVQETNLDPDD